MRGARATSTMTLSNSKHGFLLFTAGLVGCAAGAARPHVQPVPALSVVAPTTVAPAAADQREHFDELWFVPPAGWSRIDATNAQHAIYMQFDLGTREHKIPGFCMLRVSRTQAARGEVGEELAREWARVIVDGGKQPVPMIPSTNTLVIAGWTLAAGIGEYQGVAAPQVSVMIAYQRGNRVAFGQVDSVVGTTCRAEGERALATIGPQAPAAEQRPVTATATP
ncbi:MAG: hypothetical protein IPH80_07640 [Myxococcales bacterium]|nr:hypothetical protein [Myxococcales bacterium]